MSETDSTLDLFESLANQALVDDEATIEAAFRAFHAANPHVYTTLVRLAREAKAAGRARIGIGIGMLWEVMRWHLYLETKGDEYQLNNNFRSRYARLLMEREAELAGLFETRVLRAA